MSMIQKATAVAAVAWHERELIKTRVQQYVLIMSFAFLVAIVAARVATKDELPQETMKAEVVNVVADELASMTPAQPTVDAEAVEMAKVLYGQARWNSEDAQRAVCWLIINRCESSLYPNDITSVCRQENQWMGYATDNVVVESYYQIAKECLDCWRQGGMRPMSGDYVFMVWSQDEIELRTTWEKTANTRYWRVS